MFFFDKISRLKWSASNLFLLPEVPTPPNEKIPLHCCNGQGLRQIRGIYVMGSPQVSVVAIASDEFDIYRLQEGLTKKGWSLNALQFPPCIHICLTHCHTEPGVAERFVGDVENIVNCIMKDPTAPTVGAAAIYGTSQQIPDRSLVSEITALYLDKLYMTVCPSENGKPNVSGITSAD